MADEAPPKDLNISLTELHSAVTALSEKLDKAASTQPCYTTLCAPPPCVAPCAPPPCVAPCVVTFCASCYHTGPQPLCQACYGPQPLCQPCYQAATLHCVTPCAVHHCVLCTTNCTPCTAQCAKCVCCTPCAQCQ